MEGEFMNENHEEESFKFIRPQCCRRIPPKLNTGSDDYVIFTKSWLSISKASNTPHDRMCDSSDYSAWDYYCKLEIINVFITMQANPAPSRTEVEKKSLAESDGSRLNIIVTKCHVLGYSRFISLNYSWILFSLSSNYKMRHKLCCCFKMEAGLGC